MHPLVVSVVAFLAEDAGGGGGDVVAGRGEAFEVFVEGVVGAGEREEEGCEGVEGGGEEG